VLSYKHAGLKNKYLQHNRPWSDVVVTTKKVISDLKVNKTLLHYEDIDWLITIREEIS
jgi:hypothetical protein